MRSLQVSHPWKRIGCRRSPSRAQWSAGVLGRHFIHKMYCLRLRANGRHTVRARRSWSLLHYSWEVDSRVSTTTPGSYSDGAGDVGQADRNQVFKGDFQMLYSHVISLPLQQFHILLLTERLNCVLYCVWLFLVHLGLWVPWYANSTCPFYSTYYKNSRGAHQRCITLWYFTNESCLFRQILTGFKITSNVAAQMKQISCWNNYKKQISKDASTESRMPVLGSLPLEN